MNKTKQESAKEPRATTSRERLARRIVERFPDRRFESEDDVYDAIDEYDTYLTEHYE